MSEYIGFYVKVQCRKYGLVTGTVRDVTDEEITLSDINASGVRSKTLCLKSDDIVELDLVQVDSVGQPSLSCPSSASASSDERNKAPSPTTRCAYVCSTTPVRPMRPMRVIKGDDGVSKESYPTDSNAAKSHDSSNSKHRYQQSPPQKSHSKSFTSQSPSRQHSSVMQQHNSRINQVSQKPQKGLSSQTKSTRERQEGNSSVTTKGNTRRRAYSASYEVIPQQQQTHPIGRGGDSNEKLLGNGNGRRISRQGRGESWFQMDVSDMQEEFDFESNLLKFNKTEFYQQVDAEIQRQRISPRTVRSKSNIEDGNLSSASGSGRVSGRGSVAGNGVTQKKSNRDGRDSCFEMDVSQMNEEFDFEGNLAQFNKSAFYKEVDERRQRNDRQRSSPETIQKRPDVVPEPKFRHDENVISSGLQPLYHPITLPTPWLTKDRKCYACADGVVLPACQTELRYFVFKEAEKFGLTWSLVAELYGRIVAELILEQVGGRTRLRPGNEHQLPHIVVIAGPHRQGSLGLAVARHLSLRRCLVSVVTPKVVVGQLDPPDEMIEQTRLFKAMTGGKILPDLESCPPKAVDFVVSAIETHDKMSQSLLFTQPWMGHIVSYCNGNRPPCLVVDPPSSEVQSIICPRIMVGLGLPLPINLSEKNNPHYYLCDIGLSPKMLKELGITYQSPFTYRSVLQINEVVNSDKMK